MNETLLITGGAGFIGSALVRHLVAESRYTVVNVDKLTYAGNLASLTSVAESERYRCEEVDICERDAVAGIFEEHRPCGLIHLAAESHVDRSIDGPAAFVRTNVMGTAVLLEAARAYLDGLPEDVADAFRFLHVSTDEVFGSLGDEGLFDESSPYDPSSPYSASKASADHLVRAWHRTYGVPVLITNCSNNYGPYQFPEKLIPVVILRGSRGLPIPVYGDGANIRDWLFVDDHVDALMRVFEAGQLGHTYNVGARNERTNLEVVRRVCALLDELAEEPKVERHADLIEFVEDRPGHDLRYAIDPTKIECELGWTPRCSFEAGLRRTVEWYLANRDWCRTVLGEDGDLARLGLGGRDS